MNKNSGDLGKHVDNYSRTVLRWCRYAVEVLICLAITAGLNISVWWATPMALAAAFLDSRLFKT